MKRSSRIKLDLLTRRPFRVVVTSSAFPVALQAVALAAVVWLADRSLASGATLILAGRAPTFRRQWMRCSRSSWARAHCSLAAQPSPIG